MIYLFSAVNGFAVLKGQGSPEGPILFHADRSDAGWEHIAFFQQHFALSGLK